MTTNPAFNLLHEHPAERVFSHQAITSDTYLRGEPAPTRNQVAAVLHALADLTHNRHMLSENVEALGADLGGPWAQAEGLGRYFHALGDHLASPAQATAEVRAGEKLRTAIKASIVVLAHGSRDREAMEALEILGKVLGAEINAARAQQ